ncbi:hypothetical protein DID78_01215 [Candidatus Marinamargulisbacteria bacterium SCGC AG-343-D04]|nr:hypothetical protein DID78_01215 [Candidatus Marinamargulisbacteria bacterium SCGC AG-343-D04]
MENENSCCHPKSKWYTDKLIIASIIGILMMPITTFLTNDVGLIIYGVSFFKETWFPISLGLLIGGLIEYYIPRNYIEKLLANPKKRTLLSAALIGSLLSTCSHGILAISMQLYKKGASIPSVIVLLTASPWANFPITILLLKFFGLQGLLLIVISVFIAIITGLIFRELDKKHLLDHYPSNNLKSFNDFSIRHDIKKRFKAYSFSISQCKIDIKGVFNGAVNLSNMVLTWFILALIMATYLGYYIPTQLFQQYLGNNLLGLFNTLLGASVIEVCSEGSSVLAFEIHKHTGALGNVLVFLLAGVATDYTEIGLLWKTIGKKTAILLPIICIPFILLAGIALNTFL